MIWRHGKACRPRLATAEQAARAAGEIIRSNSGCCSEMAEECEIKYSIKDIVTEYDKTAQNAIEKVVRTNHPDHSFLGEEDVEAGGAASEAALLKALESSSTGWIWICDPIDGTANFASGLALCAATIGFVYKGTPVVCATYDPFSDECFTAIKGQGAFLNGERLQVSKAITSVGDAIINAGCPADPNAFETSMRGFLVLNGKSRGLRVIACSALTTAWIAAGRLTAHFGYDLSSWDLVVRSKKLVGSSRTWTVHRTRLKREICFVATGWSTIKSLISSAKLMLFRFNVLTLKYAP